MDAVWNWHVAPAAYRQFIMQCATALAAQHPQLHVRAQLQAAHGIDALEAALRAASNPRSLKGGSALQGGGGFSFLGRGNDEDGEDEEEEVDDANYGTLVERLEETPLDTSSFLPRLGNSSAHASLLYLGAPTCQADCTTAQAGDLRLCPLVGPCNNIAAVRVQLKTDQERAALLPYLSVGARPDPATDSYFLCEAHHKYVWRVSAAKGVLAAVAVVSLGAAAVLTLGPLAAAGWGLATSALGAAAAPLLSTDVWRTLRGLLRGSVTQKQAAIIAAASTAAGGQSLVLEDEVARLLRPTDRATRRLMAAYGGSVDSGARNDLVLLHALAPSEASGYVDPIARASGMPGAVTALRDMLPELRDVPPPLIAACVNLGVNSATWWKLVRAGQGVLEELVRAVTGTDADADASAKKAALALVVNWLEPSQLRLTFTPASVAKVVEVLGGEAGRATVAAAEVAFADLLLRGQLLPAASALRERLAEEAKIKKLPSGLKPLELLQAALFGDAVHPTVRAATEAAVAHVKMDLAARLPPLSAPAADVEAAVLQLQPRALTPGFKVAEEALSAFVHAILPSTASSFEHAAACDRTVAAIQGPLAASLAAHRRLLTSESPLEALARLGLVDRLLSPLLSGDKVELEALRRSGQRGVNAACRQFEADAVEQAVLLPSLLPSPAQGEAVAVGEEAAEPASRVYASALALAQVALARLRNDSVRDELAKRRRAAATVTVAAPRQDQVAREEQPAVVLAKGDGERARALALFADMARGYSSLPQWLGLLDMDADGYKVALPQLLLQAGRAFADNHAAGAMDLRKTAAFLGLTADDLLDVRRLRSRLVPLLSLLSAEVTPHRGVIELLRYNVLMLLKDGEFRDALAGRMGLPVVELEHLLAPLEAEFDAA